MIKVLYKFGIIILVSLMPDFTGRYLTEACSDCFKCKEGVDM